MSADWISVEVTLRDKPKVRAIARQLGIQVDAVVGKLVVVWGWADRVSVDGVVDGVVDADVDDLARHDGFARAMLAVGWLLVDAEAQRIQFPDFGVHHSNSAKKRLLKSARQARYRANKANGTVDTNVDASVDACSRLQESPERPPQYRREEKRTSKSKEQKTEQPQAAFVVPEWIRPEVWHGFSEMRKKKRAPMTVRACAMVCTQLIKLRDAGNDPNEVLDQSTRNSWTDVYAIKPESHAVNGAKPPISKSAQAMNAIERLKRGYQEPDSDSIPEVNVPRLGGPTRSGLD